MSIDDKFDKVKGMDDINLLPEENRPKKNKFAKGCKSFYDYYLNFSSEQAEKTPDKDVFKVYRANASGGLLSAGIGITLIPLFPAGTVVGMLLIYSGGKGVYNASRIRDKYFEKEEGIEIDKNNKLYKFGQGLKRYTEGIF